MANFGKGRKPYPEWTAAELDTIRKLFPNAAWSELIAALPARSRASINQMGRNILKLRRECNPRPKWANDEISILRRMYPKDSDEALLAALPRHSLIACQRMASALKVLRPRREAREHKRFVPAIIEQLYRERLAQHMRRPDLLYVIEWAQALGFDLVLRPMQAKPEEITVPYPDKKRLMAGR